VLGFITRSRGEVRGKINPAIREQDNNINQLSNNNNNNNNNNNKINLLMCLTTAEKPITGNN
jgi:hypothetical protein